MKNKTRILVVDDDPGIRRLLQIYLNREANLTVCAAAENTSQAINALKEQAIDLVIVGFSNNGTSGLELSERIHLRWPEIPVLIFSSYIGAIHVRLAFRLGVRGYVVKLPGMMEELIKAIYELLAGNTYVSPRISE